MMESNGNSVPNMTNTVRGGGAVDKAGCGCVGCAMGMMLCMILLIGSITLGLYGLCSVIADGEESGFTTHAPDDPENLIPLRRR